MGLVDELVAAVESGVGDEGKKHVAVGFLREVGPVIEVLGPEAFKAMMAAAAGGDVSPEIVVGSLDERQVVALLGETEVEMKGAVERHVAEVAARRAAMEALQAAALGIVARIIVGMI